MVILIVIAKISERERITRSSSIKQKWVTRLDHHLSKNGVVSGKCSSTYQHNYINIDNDFATTNSCFSTGNSYDEDTAFTLSSSEEKVAKEVLVINDDDDKNNATFESPGNTVAPAAKNKNKRY